MKEVVVKVEGITCANCAMVINNTLTKKGLDKVQVNPISGELSFHHDENSPPLSEINNVIKSLGYKVVVGEKQQVTNKKPLLFNLSNDFNRLLFCLPFTLVLFFSHLLMGTGIHFLHNGLAQALVALPVFVVGLYFFGGSAIKSLRNGIPNMDVLITVGAVSAYLYSGVNLFFFNSELLFFESASSIFTLVFLGNWLEHLSVSKTQESIKELTKKKPVSANMIAYDDSHQENIFSIEGNALKTGDLILVNSGEEVPADCKILSGTATVSEALLTGESEPLLKQQGDILIGGSINVSGSVKCYVTAVGKESTLSNIVRMMEKAQAEKPPMQKLADKISAVFVPLVLITSVIFFGVNFVMLHQTFGESLMRAISVMVVSCPCAMGIATPAAIAVGLGRGAKMGILFPKTDSLEMFSKIKQVVFDKTGTLTTGDFVIKKVGFEEGNTLNSDMDALKKLILSLEKHSQHPIAKSIRKSWGSLPPVAWKKINEIKGSGMEATDKNGNHYYLGKLKTEILGFKDSGTHNLYFYVNHQPVAWIDMEDEIREEAEEIVNYLKRNDIEPIMLSGDNEEKCRLVAGKLGISTYYHSQTPEQKLEVMEKLSASKPTLMVGDGINDAPAMSKAAISISFGNAAQLAILSSSVVLLNSGMKKFIPAMLLGRKTYSTVKSNLGWAFIYNLLAIPFAGLGGLTPTFAALLMGLSDVVLALNSLSLNYKKITPPQKASA